MNALLMLSSMGTSLLTNGADDVTRKALNRLANAHEEELTQDERVLIDSRIEAVHAALAGSNRQSWQRASAEVNSLQAYLEERRHHSSAQDMHIFLATDTYQGQQTAEIVRQYINEQGLGQAIVVTPRGLSTKGRDVFMRAMVELVNWCEEHLPPYRTAGYRIVFNLTGGFKSVQGYLNTLGMLYADELVYLFEPPTCALLTIPRLPLRLDTEEMSLQHAVTLGLLDAAGIFPVKLLPDLAMMPELYIERVMEEGEECAGLSPWGVAIWKQARKTIYAELLSWPGLRYSDEFRRDVAACGDVNTRVQLQDALARVSALFLLHHGDVSQLMRDGGVQYEKLLHAPPYEAIRITQGLRIGCERTDDDIVLHRFGMETTVYPYLERRSRDR